MGKSLKGTQTEKNLMISFAGESQARMRYTYFASAAKKEGFEQIAAIFTETAEQEKEHAKRMFKWLEGGMVEITASYPAGVIGTTAENLKAAAAGEHEEWSLDYPKFADIADEEGFPCSPMSKMEKCSRKKRRSSGNAATADSFLKALKLRKSAPHVSILRPISK